jgi:glucose/mannose-6-phosphate isomerase
MDLKNSQTILDNHQEMNKLDKSNALGSVEALADQVRHAWEAIQKIEFKAEKEIKNVVVAGMGGSGLGADVIKHLYKEHLQIPFEVVNSYTLPNYINENTLVVLSSYSGNTEEIIECSTQAKIANAQIIAIASGGKLAAIAQENGYPIYLIKPEYNPSGQPRMAIGYSIIGQLGLMAKAGIISLDQDEINEIITAIIRQNEKCKIETPADLNPAKILAFKCFDRRPILVASEFLSGAVHVSTNQFNENAKCFADYKIIPEINHHLMEGLRFPASNVDSHLYIFFNSNLYKKRNQQRFDLTAQVVEKNDIETISIDLQAESKITQIFELITLMAYTNFYLSMLEKIDPSPIPHVDWLKEQLK